MSILTPFLFDWKTQLAMLLIGLYIYLTWHHDYFKSKGIPFAKPYPFFGTSYLLIIKKLTLHDLYKKYGKVFGMFAGRNPFFVIGDEEMLKEIMVKQFPSFAKHDENKFGDKYADRILTKLYGEEWKHVRKSLAPTFTSGKLKDMAKDINTCCQDMVTCLNDLINQNHASNMDFKSFNGKFTMDLIGRTIFGLKVNSQKDTENEFLKHAKGFIRGKGWRSVLLSPLFFVCPSLLKYLGKLDLGLLPHSTSNFFANTVNELLNLRENDISKRNDFMALMVKENRLQGEGGGEENTGKPHGLKKIDILASGLLFFLAGFDTVSSGLSGIMYCLAQNPEWQEKILEEIQTVLKEKKGNDDISSDELKEMHLLEMVIEESFRMTSPVPFNDRIATEDATVKGLFIEKGTLIWIPIHAIHHDPDYFPDPETFDPLRFTPEAKASRSKFVDLTFGVGPRECLGKRLGMMQLKMVLVYLLRGFKLTLPTDDKGLIRNVFQEVTEVKLSIENRKQDVFVD